MTLFHFKPRDLFVTDEAITLQSGHTEKSVQLGKGVVENGIVRNQELFQMALNQLFSGRVKGKKVSIRIPEDLVYYHKLDIPPKKSRDENLVTQSAREIFPIDLDTAYRDYRAEKEGVHFAAVSKKVIDPLIEAAEAVGMSLVGVDSARDISFNLLPASLKAKMASRRVAPGLVTGFLIIFAFFTCNIFMLSVRLANDYSNLLLNRQNLLGIQNIVETVYAKDVMRQHFERIQLSQQINRILDVRLPSSLLLERLEELNTDGIELQEIKLLHKEGSDTPILVLTALSSGRESTQMFNENLQSNSLFTDVDLPLSFFSKKGENLIEVSLQLDEAAYLEIVRQIDHPTQDDSPKLPERPAKKTF